MICRRSSRDRPSKTVVLAGGVLDVRKLLIFSTNLLDLIAGLGRRAHIAGFDLVELYPPADIDGLSALTAARLVVNAIGAIVRQA